MNSLPRVLIVDRSAESREILRTLLELRGAATLEAAHPEHALKLAEEFQPNLIVLDAESDATADGEAAESLRQAAGRSATPIVILGKLRHSGGPPGGGQFIAKPYHYAPLIRKIENLLAPA